MACRIPTPRVAVAMELHQNCTLIVRTGGVSLVRLTFEEEHDQVPLLWSASFSLMRLDHPGIPRQKHSPPPRDIITLTDS